MPDPARYQLEFRPRSYWGPQELSTYLRTHLKGELRRQTACHLLARGGTGTLNLSETLPLRNLRAKARTRPWFMGGEYLPDLLPNEVEIARIVRTRGDMEVISIRARKTRRRIFYRIVDEVEDGAPYPLTQASSTRPLTLAKLIRLIDTALQRSRLPVDAKASVGAAWSADNADTLLKVSSAFYSELEDWYDEARREQHELTGCSRAGGRITPP